MSSSFLEIIQLENGEYALKKMDSEEDSLVTIKFSSEVSEFLSDQQAEVAKAMISAGVQAASVLSQAAFEADQAENPEANTLH